MNYDEMWDELKGYLELEFKDADTNSKEYREGLKHALELVDDLEDEKD